MLRSASIRGQIAAFCFDLGSNCCVLPRFGLIPQTASCYGIITLMISVDHCPADQESVARWSRSMCPRGPMIPWSRLVGGRKDTGRRRGEATWPAYLACVPPRSAARVAPRQRSTPLQKYVFNFAILHCKNRKTVVRVAWIYFFRSKQN